MKSRRWIISAGLVIAVAIGVVGFWPGPKEPEYQGKKLSEWLAVQLEQPGECAEAVRAIGTNAVPFLLNWLEFELPVWKLKVIRFYARHPTLPGEAWVLSRMPRQTGVFRRTQAAFRGFVLLGDRASNAVPRLAYNTSNSWSGTSASLSANSLSYLGPRAVGPLVDIATNRALPPSRRASAISAMRNMTYLGTNAAACIEAFVKAGCDTNAVLASSAKLSLTTFTQTEGKPLAGMSWTNAAPDALLRRWAMRAAIDFATNSDSFIYTLISQGTNDPDPAVRAEAVQYVDRRKAYWDAIAAKHE